MGEGKISMTVKLTPERYAEFQRELDKWRPAIRQNSPMAELLIDIGMAVLSAGIVARTPEAVQRLLGQFSEVPEVLEVTQLRFPIQNPSPAVRGKKLA